jgi:DNA-3-methyladenine glycosylase
MSDPNAKHMRPIVEAKVLQQKKTVALARWLLGKHLVRRWADGREDARMIVETEAYNGEQDQACHARAGRTARTDVMYGPGGVWYVYLCYGIHEMLNLVVGPADWPAAILIRGIEGAIGPGRVTKALAIDRSLNRASATEENSGLWLEDRGVRVPANVIQKTPRIGIDYAGPIWSEKHWRFMFDPQAVPPPRARRRRAELSLDPDRAVRRERWEPVAPRSAGPSVRRGAGKVLRMPLQGD